MILSEEELAHAMGLSEAELSLFKRLVVAIEKIASAASGLTSGAVASPVFIYDQKPAGGGGAGRIVPGSGGVSGGAGGQPGDYAEKPATAPAFTRSPRSPNHAKAAAEPRFTPSAANHTFVDIFSRGIGEGFRVECSCGWCSRTYKHPKEAHDVFQQHLRTGT